MRTVVTGIGVLAPNGVGTEPFWRGTLDGVSGIDRIGRFDASAYPIQLAGEVDDFDAAEHIPNRLLPQTDRVTQMALAAADWAVADAAIDPKRMNAFDMGVVTANSSGGFEFGQRELENLWGRGPDHVSAYQSFAWFYAVNTGQISIRHGMRGPGAVLVTEQAGGLDAVGHARRQLRKGVRMALTGGIDSSMCPWAWVAHQVSGGLSHSNNPEKAYLPFDHDANGYVTGEGGAIFVLETAESAAARYPVRVYGEIAGYAATFDSKVPGRPPGLRRAAELALADADLSPKDIDVVFADAAGQPDLDKAEAEAISGLFGPFGVPVTAPKTMTGRLFAGGASIDLAAALMSVWDGVIPPTINVHNPNKEYELDLVLDQPRHQRVRAALVLARGRGGYNSAMVVCEYNR